MKSQVCSISAKAGLQCGSQPSVPFIIVFRSKVFTDISLAHDRRFWILMVYLFLYIVVLSGFMVLSVRKWAISPPDVKTVSLSCFRSPACSMDCISCTNSRYPGVHWARGDDME